MTTPIYTAGEMIEATLSFTSYARTPVHGVTAYFARHLDQNDNRTFEEKEPTEKIWLKGTPIQESLTEQSPTWRVTLSSPIVEANEPGLYRCHFIEAQYAGARNVRFQTPPNAEFRIQHENIPAPAGIGWEWGESIEDQHRYSDETDTEEASPT